MPVSEQQLLDLIELTYSAALDRSQWPRLMASIAQAVGGQGGTLNSTDYASRTTDFLGAVGYDPNLLPAYRDYYIHIDPYREFFESTPAGQLKPASNILSREFLTRSEFHNEFMRPQDKEYAAGAPLLRHGNVTVKFGVHRSRKAGDFTEENLRVLRLLLPHLTRAVQVQQQLAAASAQQDIAFSTLDHLRIGVFLLDANGVVIYRNREAENLCNAGELIMRNKRLTCTSALMADKLQTMIVSASRTTPSADVRQGGTLELSSKVHGGAGVEIRVIPLILRNKQLDIDAQSGKVAVFASRPGSLRLPWPRIAHFYGLSAAEAKLTAALVEGGTLETAATQLCVSMNTVRTQLKSIFAKTETHRQSELIAKLLGGVLAWCNHEQGPEN